MKVKQSTALLLFFRSSHRSLAEEILSISLHDLLRSQALVTVHYALLASERSLNLLHFDVLNGRSWKTLHIHCLTSKQTFKTCLFLGSSRAALTLLFGIFILFAPLFLGLVSTLCFNHRLHSFLGFLRVLKGPHGDGASAFTALLCHSGVQVVDLRQRGEKTEK